MKVSEVISRVDRTDPNQFDADMKIAWLSDLDGQIYDEVVLTHEHGYEPWRAPTDINDTLLIPEPFAQDCYDAYLRAKMAEANLESVRFNQHMSRYNGAYQKFVNWYNRNHMPLPAKGGNRLRF